MGRYMTDEQLAQFGFPDNETAALAATDADIIYEHVAASPAETDSDLEQFTIAQWGAEQAGERRVNALRVLAAQGRVINIGG